MFWGRVFSIYVFCFQNPNVQWKMTKLVKKAKIHIDFSLYQSEIKRWCFPPKSAGCWPLAPKINVMRLLLFCFVNLMVLYCNFYYPNSSLFQNPGGGLSCQTRYLSPTPAPSYKRQLWRISHFSFSFPLQPPWSPSATCTGLFAIEHRVEMSMLFVWNGSTSLVAILTGKWILLPLVLQYCVISNGVILSCKAWRWVWIRILRARSAVAAQVSNTLKILSTWLFRIDVCGYDHPSGPEYNQVTVKEGGICEARCGIPGSP